MAWVYEFAEGNKDQKDLLGGKGANLAEMTNLGLPVPPGFTISTETCRAYLAATGEGGEPEGLAEEVTEHLARARGGDGQAARRRRRPAAGLGALGREVLDARDDGDRPQRRPQRRRRSAGWPPAATTSASPWTPTAGCCRCSAAPCSHVDSEHFSDALDEAKTRQGHRDRPRPRRRRPARAGRDASRRSSRSRPAATSRRTRASSSTSRSARSSTPGTPTARGSTAARSGSPRTSAPRSTSRRWSSATSAWTPAPASPSPATRPAASRACTATTCRTRRARTSSPASATPCRWPTWPRSTRRPTTS